MKTVLVLLALAVSVVPSRALADSYKLEFVDIPSLRGVIGPDDYGDYEVDFTSPLCGGVDGYLCREEVYADGSVSQPSPDPFTLQPDPASVVSGGNACAIEEPGFTQGAELLCNNGHTLIEGTYTAKDGTVVQGVWSGDDPDPVADLIAVGYFQGGHITSDGNAQLLETRSDQTIVAIDTTSDPPQVVPEPRMVWLVGAAALLLLSFRRANLSNGVSELFRSLAGPQ